MSNTAYLCKLFGGGGARPPVPPYSYGPVNNNVMFLYEKVKQF